MINFMICMFMSRLAEAIAWSAFKQASKHHRFECPCSATASAIAQKVSDDPQRNSSRLLYSLEYLGSSRKMAQWQAQRAKVSLRTSSHRFTSGLTFRCFSSGPA